MLIQSEILLAEVLLLLQQCPLTGCSHLAPESLRVDAGQFQSWSANSDVLFVGCGCVSYGKFILRNSEQWSHSIYYVNDCHASDPLQNLQYKVLTVRRNVTHAKTLCLSAFICS